MKTQKLLLHLLREGTPRQSAVFGDHDRSGDQPPIYRPSPPVGALAAPPMSSDHEHTEFTPNTAAGYKLKLQLK